MGKWKYMLGATIHHGIMEVLYMYLTIRETAEHLELPEDYIELLVLRNQIRAVYDGTQYLINQNQFQTHWEQIEKYRAMIQSYLSEELPEDPDVKDED